MDQGPKLQSLKLVFRWQRSHAACVDSLWVLRGPRQQHQRPKTWQLHVSACYTAFACNISIPGTVPMVFHALGTPASIWDQYRGMWSDLVKWDLLYKGLVVHLFICTIQNSSQLFLWSFLEFKQVFLSSKFVLSVLVSILSFSSSRFISLMTKSQSRRN